MIRLLTISLFIFLSMVGRSQPNGEHWLIINAKAHVGNGDLINQSYISFKDGKITDVGNVLLKDLEMAIYDTVIDAKGKHIYPGFIAPNSTLGLVEIDAVRATRDFSEVGDFKPNVRTSIAYNTDSEIIPTVRSNGILMAEIAPRSGRISGSSSIMKFDGINWQDALIKEDVGIHINWPRMFKRRGWWAEPGTTVKNDKYRDQVNDLIRFMREAKAYVELKDHEERDLRFESMRGVFNGDKIIFVHVDFVKEIIEMINMVKELDLPRVVIVGGYDSWMVTDQLKENDISVMVRRIHSLPKRPGDDLDLPFELPRKLYEADVPFCLENSGDMEAMGTRNLPFYAGTASTYGLPYEVAVASISYNTAKILGIGDRTGSLETGKDATLFISDGDALDMRTNNVVFATVQGESIDLSNRQKELYLKYKKHYEELDQESAVDK